MECDRGPGIYARRSQAYARVFVYLCGTPENPVDERDTRPREGGGGGAEVEEEEAEEDARVRRAREGPYPMKGKDEDGEKSQWPTKVCCPFVTRERVGRYTRESIRLCSKNTRKQTTATPPSSPPHRHAAYRARFSPSGPSFSFSHTVPVTSASPLLSLSFSLCRVLASLCSSKFQRGVPRP